jgi:protein TonB
MSKFKFTIWPAIAFVAISLSISAQTPQPENTPPAAATAKAPKRVPSAEQEKMLKKKVAPIYPKDAYDAKLTGVISLETTIGVDGKVTNLRLIGLGDPLLVKAAEDAVKQWVYKPTMEKGMPIEVVTIVQLNFKVGE